MVAGRWREREHSCRGSPETRGTRASWTKPDTEKTRRLPRSHPRTAACKDTLRLKAKKAVPGKANPGKMMPPVEEQTMPLSSGRVAGESPPPRAGSGRRCTWAVEGTRRQPCSWGLSVVGTHLHLNNP